MIPLLSPFYLAVNFYFGKNVVRYTPVPSLSLPPGAFLAFF